MRGFAVPSFLFGEQWFRPPDLKVDLETWSLNHLTGEVRGSVRYRLEW